VAICDSDVNEFSVATVSTAGDTAGVEGAVIEVAEGLVAAASEFDPAAFAGHMSEDGLYIFGGRILEGRQAVEDHYISAWEGVRDGAYVIDDLNVHVLGSNAAVVTSQTTFEIVTDTGGEDPVTGNFIFSAVMERSGDNWYIVHMSVST
jgi:uncharacterized protein (TIGR02246 family)